MLPESADWEKWWLYPGRISAAPESRRLATCSSDSPTLDIMDALRFLVESSAVGVFDCGMGVVDTGETVEAKDRPRSDW